MLGAFGQAERASVPGGHQGGSGLICQLVCIAGRRAFEGDLQYENGKPLKQFLEIKSAYVCGYKQTNR